jgi:hypothetical protein
LERNDVLISIIEAKRLRITELSELSFKKKIEILIQLQDTAKGIQGPGKDNKNTVWSISFQNVKFPSVEGEKEMKRLHAKSMLVFPIFFLLCLVLLGAYSLCQQTDLSYVVKELRRGVLIS